MIRSLPYKLLFLFIFLLDIADGCPSHCSCPGTTVVCRAGSLQANIQEVPKTTVQLVLLDGYINSNLKQSLNSAEGLTQLKNLTIKKHTINQIADETFSNFSNLRYLVLTQNSIMYIQKQAFVGLRNLVHLDLSFNIITHIDSIFYPLKRLEFLFLSWNRLSTLPAGTFRSLVGLKRLVLDGNNLQNIHSYSFQWLRNLLHLSLSNCQLSLISNDLFTITRSLISLDLSSNRITKVPTLKILRNLPNLRLLSLYNNSILNLVSDQFSGVKLDTLNLSVNNIRKISDETFQYFNTKALDLSQNSIDNLASGSLRPIAPQLEYLNLAGNPLQNLPPDAFEGLYRLLELNLSDCSMNSLHSNQFVGPNGLQRLDLSTNNLRNLPSSIVNFFSNLESVNLEGNYWKCDCHISEFRNWLQRRASARKIHCVKTNKIGGCEPIQCMYPVNLYQHSIKQLRDDEISKCLTEVESRDISSNMVVVIAVSSSVFAMVVLVTTIVVWKWACKKSGINWLCTRSVEDSSHLDKSNKPRPFQDIDIGSLNESDRSFNVRNYFDSMVQNPASLSRGTPSLTQKDYNSNLGSLNSIYSVISYAYGRESAV